MTSSHGNSWKAVGKLFCLVPSAVILLNVPAYAQNVDWSRVSPQARNWIESSCNTERSMGPSYYFPCIERNVAALQSTAATIDLSKLDQKARAWIESSCSTERGMGPSYYYPCIGRNVAALQGPASGTDLSKLDPQTRSWIESSCSTERGMGPSYYYPCIQRNVQASRSSTPPPVEANKSNLPQRDATPLPKTQQTTPPTLQGSSTNTSQRREIQMVRSGGTYGVPVTINDAISLTFILDSGASDVSIPTDVFSTLVRSGTITDADMLGSQTYVLADGSKKKSPTFRIRSLKIGSVVVENVTASVAENSAPLLLGMSFLSRFPSWSVDNSRHVLILR